MAINEILPFATDPGANVLDPAAYAAFPFLGVGLQPGQAFSQQWNTPVRQATFIAAMIAQYIVDESGEDVLDDGDLPTLLANFRLSTTGRLLSTQVFTASGTYIPNPKMSFCIVEVVGGGAGGGGTASTSAAEYSVGGGGSSGAYAKSIIPASTIGFSKAVTIGAGGAGGAGNNFGDDGGDTTFGALITAPGGYGGGGGVATSTLTSLLVQGGSKSAIATGGSEINVTGQAGGSGLATAGFALSGAGGGSPIAGGAGGGSNVGLGTVGDSATGYGAGGSGSCADVSDVARYGGDGKDGVIIIYEYS